eukprot:1741874-Amphidinium_carterae.1
MKTFVDDATQSTGMHSKLYACRDVQDDPSLLYAAKIRLSVAHAQQAMTCSGSHSVFARPARHSEALLKSFAMIWLTEEQMRHKPLILLRNIVRQHSLLGGLCRSTKLFG